MLKEFVVGLVVLAFVIPFSYIIIADIADVAKRLHNAFSHKVKPALIVLTRTLID